MGQTREQKIIKQVTGVPTIEKKVPIATDMFLPNYSGIQNAAKKGSAAVLVSGGDIVGSSLSIINTNYSLVDEGTQFSILSNTGYDLYFSPKDLILDPTDSVVLPTTTPDSMLYVDTNNFLMSTSIPLSATFGGTGRRDNQSQDMDYFRHVSDATWEIWYPAGHVQTNTMTTAAIAIDTLYGIPFVSGRGGTLDRIAMNCTTLGAAGSKLRFGIYTAYSDTNLYPDALVVDSGEFASDAAPAIKSASINITLTPGKLYWFVCLCGTAAPVVRGGQQTSMRCILGTNNTLGTANNSKISVAQAYGALPANFPNGAALASTGALPFVYIRYSA